MHREVTSFVRRSARMRPNQRVAYAAQTDRFVVVVAQGETDTSVAADVPRLDLGAVFGREAPLVVEIGSGPGESLVPMAAARPDTDLLAFEVYEPAVARLVSRLARECVTNVRVVRTDAVAGLDRLLPPSRIQELWTFFPDPWPKTRHRKRRLIGPAFADLAVGRLEPGGCWRLATDWPDYAEQMRAVLGRHPALIEETPDRGDRPSTRFERRGQAAGRSIIDLVYRRRTSWPEPGKPSCPG